MGITLYTLKEDKDSGELHLFEGTPTADNTVCVPKKKSICKKMIETNKRKNIFVCKSETTARNECARIGRKVCGSCVSHLYSSY